jgi:hypothetical protein
MTTVGHWLQVHLVGAGEQCRWHFEAQGLSASEIDREFVFRRGLNRQVAGSFSFKNTINIASCEAVLGHDSSDVRRSLFKQLEPFTAQAVLKLSEARGVPSWLNGSLLQHEKLADGRDGVKCEELALRICRPVPLKPDTARRGWHGRKVPVADNRPRNWPRAIQQSMRFVHRGDGLIFTPASVMSKLIKSSPACSGPEYVFRVSATISSIGGAGTVRVSIRTMWE